MKSKPNYPLKRIVEVEWRDSCSVDLGWDSPSAYRERDKVGPIRSIGYLLTEGPNIVQLIQNQSHQTGDLSGMITIPRENVLHIWRRT